MFLFFFFMADWVISGSGFEPGADIILKAWSSNHQFEMGSKSQSLQNGTFRIQLTDQKPNLFLITIGETRIELAISNATDVQIIKKGKSIKVVGSPNTDAANAFGNKLNHLNQTYFGDLKKRAEIVLEGDDKLAKTELLKERDEALEKFWLELQLLITELGPTPAGFSALQVLDIHKQHEFIAAQLTRFEEVLPDNPMTATIQYWVETSKDLAVGKIAPAFELLDSSGTTVPSSTWTGSYVFLDFWASWCPNCKAEFPELVEVYDQFRPKGFQVIGITSRDNKHAWQQTQKRFNLPWPNYFESKPIVTERFAAKQLPTNFLIDPSGTIVLRNVTARELEAYLIQTYN